MDPTQIQKTHPPNRTGVRPGTEPYPPNIMRIKPGTGPNKSSHNTSTKYSGSKARNWTLQNLRQNINNIEREQDQELDHIKVQTIHLPNITGVRPRTEPYKF